MLAALATRTGVDFAQLRAMTLAGWAPWLFDPPGPHPDQEAFETYVRQNSVLFPPKAAPSYQVSHGKPWHGPWIAGPRLHRACPRCAADADRGTGLLWQLPLMAGCGEHGCLLQDRIDVEVLGEQELPVTAVAEPVVTLDRYTHQALTTGLVDLPGRTVHAGVWFRLLRSLLNELTLPASILNQRNKDTLNEVWRAAGLPARAGLAVWRPYEHLPWATQQHLLHAAAIALQLVAEGRIRARGIHGPALAPLGYQPVHEGDRPPPDFNALAEAAINQARTDRAAAHQLLQLLTFACRTLDRFEEQRAYLCDIGIPAGFLPTAPEFGRTDLV